jgi:hypothetical protein
MIFACQVSTAPSVLFFCAWIETAAQFLLIVPPVLANPCPTTGNFSRPPAHVKAKPPSGGLRPAFDMLGGLSRASIKGARVKFACHMRCLWLWHDRRKT